MSKNIVCLIDEASCGRVAGKDVCPKCGMDSAVVYPGESDLRLAQNAARRMYRKFEAEASSLIDDGVSIEEQPSRQQNEHKEQLERERRKSQESLKWSERVSAPQASGGAAKENLLDRDRHSGRAEISSWRPVLEHWFGLLVVLAVMVACAWGWKSWKTYQRSLLTTDRYQVSASGSEVKDLTTGLVWSRCSLGQRWNGLKCLEDGEKVLFSYAEAESVSMAGWRLPTVRELHTLVNCTDGLQEKDWGQVDPRDGGPKLGTCKYKYSDNMRPMIHEAEFPGIESHPSFWANAVYGAGPRLAWQVDFYSGTVGVFPIDRRARVRLVRSSS